MLISPISVQGVGEQHATPRAFSQHIAQHIAGVSARTVRALPLLTTAASTPGKMQQTLYTQQPSVALWKGPRATVEDAGQPIPIDTNPFVSQVSVRLTLRG